MHININLHIHTHKDTCTYTLIYVHIHKYTHKQNIHKHKHTCTYIYTYISTHKHIHIYKYTYTHIRTQTSLSLYNKNQSPLSLFTTKTSTHCLSLQQKPEIIDGCRVLQRRWGCELWPDTIEKKFILYLLEEAINGNTPFVWRHVAKVFNEQLGKNHSPKQLKDKHKRLKMKYEAFSHLISRSDMKYDQISSA